MIRKLAKIAVIYTDHIPPLDTTEWQEPSGDLQVNYISEIKLARSAPALRPDISLVVYQLTETPRLSLEQLQNSFPGAFIVTCSKAPLAHWETVSHAAGYSLHLSEPLSCMKLWEILDMQALTTSFPCRAISDQNSSEEVMAEFFQTFINLVEVSTNREEFALVFGDLTKKIARRLHAERCLFYLYSEAEGRFCRALTVQSDDGQNLMDFYFNNAILEEVIGGGVAYVDNAFEGKLADGPGRTIAVRSILCYPLIKNIRRIGVLEVINKIDAAGFNENDKEFLARIIHTLTIIMDNAILFQNVERLCFTDDLTKLYNSRYLKQFLTTEVKRTLRYRKKVSLLFIDIDRFKAVNDIYGHLTGSETLVEIGRVLKAAVRDTDVVVRYGGDEFVIVLPETPTERAMEVAERIRSKVENYRFGVKQNLTINLTVSIGIATCSEHAMTAEGLIQKADIAMYQAKGFSKNSVRIAV